MKNIEKNNYVSKIFLIQNQYIFNLLVTSFIGTELILHTKYILNERILTYFFSNVLFGLGEYCTQPLKYNLEVGNIAHNPFKV